MNLKGLLTFLKSTKCSILKCKATSRFNMAPTMNHQLGFAFPKHYRAADGDQPAVIRENNVHSFHITCSSLVLDGK